MSRPTKKSSKIRSYAPPKLVVNRAKATKGKKSVAPLSNARLLELAQTRKPPQSWYDETIDPFEPRR